MIPSIIAFIVSIAAIPLCLFAWFGADSVLFPIFLWSSTAELATLLAHDSLEAAGPLWIALETGLADMDDFSHNDIIDQFETAAIRYQLYGTQKALGLYQYVYAPNFHGYLNKAQRIGIEKCFTEKVVGFWKWESMWEKFNAHDWDPIVMVSCLAGISGMILADRLLGIPCACEVKARFRKTPEEEFTTQDGTILPIRCELTGFNVSSPSPFTRYESMSFHLELYFWRRRA
ncbi:hypothetical protein K469DRAFT_775419 [Zopfia rhizophila CBS 207.26]|uniref:Linalool dehydratase/isomerase domain-containing protein n=1 Tax=Zopfia rhizophila CBS 207.26 TaxID=1314779 RepID=A0A6A6E8U7_9PEZI|nr:hypothetical protein K469DRAFT_775419 [Zopfia rhizophila CBS 207.26]